MLYFHVFEVTFVLWARMSHCQTVCLRLVPPTRLERVRLLIRAARLKLFLSGFAVALTMVW